MPLGLRSLKFLRGESKIVDYYEINQHEIADFIKKRWMIPRAMRDNSYMEFKKEQYSIVGNLKIED